MLAAFFLGVLAASIIFSGFQVLDAWIEAKRRVRIARWRHNRKVVVDGGLWPEGQFADL